MKREDFVKLGIDEELAKSTNKSLQIMQIHSFSVI